MKFFLGLTKRSRGTVQHDWFEWTRHKASYSAGHYTLAVASYEKWGREEHRVPPLPYAVVVRVEDLSRTVKVYTEVRQILRVPPIKT